MLKKLFKYDFKALGRIMLPAYAATLVVGLVSGILNSYSSLVKPFKNGIGIETNYALAGVTTALYIMLFAATCILCVILSITRFKGNILGKEGYITNTLPVSVSKHIWSKTLSATLWQVITIIFAIVSAFVTIFVAYGNNLYFPSIKELWKAFLIFLDRINGGDVKLITIFILQMIGYGACAVILLMSKNLMYYASMAIGHMANTKKVLKSFLAYIGLYLISQAINVFAINIYAVIARVFDFQIDFAADMFSSFWYVFIPLLLYAVFYFAVYFAVTKVVLEKKLNLE